MINADCTEKRQYVCSMPSLDQPYVRSCPLGYITYKNKCFYSEPQQSNFVNAAKTCAMHGGQLINLFDQATYQFIRAYAVYNALPDMFLGLNLTTNISSR